MNPTEDQNPAEDRPLRRRWSPEEARAAFAHTPLTIDEVREVTGHESLETLGAYRREVQVPSHNVARKLLLGGISYREIADAVTGHRCEDTAALYVRQQNPFERDVEDNDQQ